MCHIISIILYHILAPFVSFGDGTATYRLGTVLPHVYWGRYCHMSFGDRYDLAFSADVSPFDTPQYRPR